MTDPTEPPKAGKRKPTMAEVAELAGVSQATVSMVMNDVGGSRVKAETAKAVRRAARTLGYSLNRRAPTGAGATQVIGYVIEDTFTNPLVNMAIEAARQTAWESGCVLLVLPTKGESRLRTAALEVLLEQRLAGVILSSLFTAEITLPRLLRSENTILLNCYTSSPRIPAVLPAHREGAIEGVRHLVQRGHRRIALINGLETMEGFADRRAGFEAALQEHGIPVNSAHVKAGDLRVLDGQRATAELMSEANPPTAIFCASDQLALGCYEELKSRGIKVGQDVAVMGFDNYPMARTLDPPLTTVAVPHAEMGEIAVRHLLAKRDGRKEDVIKGRCRVPTPLAVRDSA